MEEVSFKMMRANYHQGHPNPGYYPQSMPNYWGGYSEGMQYHAQSMPSYPFHVAGDSVMQPYQHSGIQQEPYSFQPYPQQPMNIGGAQTPQGATMSSYSPTSQSFNPFDNPLQPQIKRPPYQAFSNPYPKQQFMQKAQPSGFQSVLNQFKTQDGSVDITKMMNTAGQMVNTFTQMSSVFKGVGSLFKIT